MHKASYLLIIIYLSSLLSESLPKEEERYTRSPARITYPLKRLAQIRRIFLDGYGVLDVRTICLGVDLEPDKWIKDNGCSKHMTGNRKLFSTYKAYNSGNVIFGSNLRGNIIGKGKICDNKCRVTFSEHDSEITKNGKVIGRASKELVRNLPKLKFDQHFYDACKIGKQAHASHKAKNIV
ncbi:hypothetical protein Tco_0359066 [Tanacetum coccineum]